MTDSPSEPTGEAVAAGDAPGEAATQESSALAAELAALVGSSEWYDELGTVRIHVERGQWVEALRAARDQAGLRFFSWLSGVDWSREVTVGEPVADTDALEERFEVIARLSSVEDARGAQFVAEVPKDDPVIDSIVPLFPGAEWHERETWEMFGIDFRGNSKLVKLYLPDAFEGNPLLKSYPLLSREVKPWPGTVDVEDMPSTDNREAAAMDATGDEGGEG